MHDAAAGMRDEEEDDLPPESETRHRVRETVQVLVTRERGVYEDRSGSRTATAMDRVGNWLDDMPAWGRWCIVIGVLVLLN
jgi:hypothetical protein